MKVVVCSEIQWHWVRTRKQQLLRRFPADWPILFLQAYARDRPNAWRPRRDGRVVYVTVPAMKSVPAGPVRQVLDTGIGRALANLLLAIWVAVVRAVTGFGGRDVALLVSNIFYGRILGGMPRRIAVYDCNDNHLAFPGTPQWAQGYLARVVRDVDVVVVSQELLREEIDPLSPRRVVEIGNGVDFALFDRAFAAPVIPAAVASAPKPRIGYAGAIADWIDLELVGAVAAAIPGGSVILVGPAVGRPAALERLLAAHPNVRWLGPMPHEDLPHAVAGMDVCLIPFRSTPLTRGVNPNKLWEYWAVGKPVVSTDFSPFLHRYAHLVRIGGSEAAFVAAVQAMLVAPPDPEALRAEARRHSWDDAAARLVALLGEPAGK